MEKLPIETIYGILKYVGFKDIIHLKSTCKWIYQLINNSSHSIIWKELAIIYGYNIKENNNYYNINQNNQNNSLNINWYKKFRKYYHVGNNWKNGNYETKSIDAHAGGVFCLSFYHRLLVTGSFDNLIKVWDRKTFGRVGLISGHTGWIWDIKLKHSKSTHSLLSISSSQDTTIQISNMTSALSNIHNSELNNTNNNLTVNAPLVKRRRSLNEIGIHGSTVDSKYIIFKHSKKLVGHQGTVWCVMPDRDKRYVYSGSSDTFVKVWEMDSGESYNIGKHLDIVLCITRCKWNDALVASGSADHSIRIWDTRFNNYDRSITSLNGHHGFVNSLTSFNHYNLASGGDDKQIKIWDIRNGKSSFSAPSSPSSSSSSSSPSPPNSPTSSTSSNCIQSIQGHGAEIRTIKIKNDRMVTGSSDMLLKTWDLNKIMKNAGQGISPQCILRGHTGSVVCLQFDSKRIITGALDSTIREWNFNTPIQDEYYYESVSQTIPIVTAKNVTPPLSPCSRNIRSSPNAGQKKNTSFTFHFNNVN